MTEHFNPDSVPTVASLTNAIARANQIIGPDGENSVQQHLMSANECVLAGYTTLGEMTEDSNSLMLTEAYTATGLASEQIQKTLATVMVGVGHLSVYESSVKEPGQNSTQTSQKSAVGSMPNNTKGGSRQRRDRQRIDGDHDPILTTKAMRLTPAEAQSYVRTQEQFESLVPYNSLAMETAKAVRHGNHDAFFIPGVQFVLDSVVAALSQGTVNARMPLEVVDRSAIAIDDSHVIAGLATRTRLLKNFYETNPYLTRITAAHPELASGLLDADLIGRLTAAVFSDVAFVAGGALKAMHTQEMPGDVQRLIRESASLKLFAGIPKDEAHGLVIELGLPPDPRYYKVSSKEGRLASVDFSDALVARIRKLMGSGIGCPIRQLKSDEPHARTGLDHAWNQVVGFLVPPGATASNPPVKSFYKRSGGIVSS